MNILAVLIETRLNSLKLNESAHPRKGCLGRLEGICADFKKPTRNGRLYPKKLWENVFKDPIFKESLESKTLLGELDHPEDRLEVLAGEACIVMTDYQIDDDAGVIRAGFDILDTPRGRILKSLLDYGCVMGVSSRGQGDISESADGEIVDEDTYEFACFDVVTTPAVEKARQNVVESVNKTRRFTESINSQITTAETIDDLNAIERVIKTTNLPDVDSIMESINNKRNSLIEGRTTSSNDEELQKAKDTIQKLEKQLEDYSSANTIRENKEMFNCISNLRKQVSAYKHRESRLVESIKSRDRKIKSLQTTKESYTKSGKQLKTENASLNKEMKSLNETVEALDVKLSKCQSKIAQDSRNLSIVEKKLSAAQESLKAKDSIISEHLDTIQSLETTVSELHRQLNSLESVNEQTSQRSERAEALMESEINSYSDIIDGLQNQVQDLKEQVSKYSTQNKSLSKRCGRLVQSLSKYQESYLNSKSKQCGIDPNHVRKFISESTTVQNINSLVEEMQSTKDRYAKLPISENVPIGVVLDSTQLKSNSDEEYERIEKFVQQVTDSM